MIPNYCSQSNWKILFFFNPLVGFKSMPILMVFVLITNKFISIYKKKNCSKIPTGSQF